MGDGEQLDDGALRATCDVHGLALADDGTCLRCRSEAGNSSWRPSWQLIVIGCSVVMVALIVYAVAREGGDDVVPTAAIDRETTGESEPEALRQPQAKARKRRRARAGAARRADEDGTRGGAAEEPSGEEDEGERKRARQLELQREMRRIPIKIYSTSWCPHCTKARVWLKANQFSFTEYDVERDSRARDERNRLNPRKSVPTIDIDGKVTLVGFSQQRVRSTLERMAEERVP